MDVASSCSSVENVYKLVTGAFKCLLCCEIYMTVSQNKIFLFSFSISVYLYMSIYRMYLL